MLKAGEGAEIEAKRKCDTDKNLNVLTQNKRKILLLSLPFIIVPGILVSRKKKNENWTLNSWVKFLIVFFFG